jgi:hypothetical protein
MKVDPKLGGQRKEKKKVPPLSGQWKEKEKVPPLGGQWKEKEKVPPLGGQWGGSKKKLLFTSSHFPSNQFYLNLQFFTFDLKVLLYQGSRPLRKRFLPFLDL